MTKIGIGFQLSASAAGMSQGINAGVVELQKLGYQAKRTANDVAVLRTIEIGRVFLNSIRTVATTFQQFTSGASSAIDQTNKLSRALGISFEELQQLQLAADLSGASSETLANAFTRAQVTITKAARGGVEATRSLRSLGLSVSELAGLSSSQQFERIATAIAAIQNPAQRAAAAVAIFGRSGAQLLPTFQELASNLQRAEAFFGGFSASVQSTNAGAVREINKALSEAGATSGQLSDAISRTQSVISNASGLSAESLERLGLSLRQLEQLTPQRRFAEIASAISRVADPAERARLAVQAFGQAGQSLLPAFASLSQAIQSAGDANIAFKRGLTGADASNIEAVNDAFTEVGKSVQEVAGLVISRLSPALLRGSESLRTFIQSVNIDDVARRAGSALEQFARAAELLANIVSVGLQRPLFAAGAALAFINRQAIASGVVGLGRAFAAAASAAVGLATSSTVAAASLVALRASITGLLTATGVGAAVVVFGLLTEAAVNFATRGTDAAVNVEAEVKKVSAAVKKAQADFGGLGNAAVQAGAKVKAALAVPNVTFFSLAQDAVGQAASSVAELARELGGLDRVPAEILTQFGEIQLLVKDANTDLVNQQQIAGEILTRSQRLTESLKAQAEARNRDTEAARRANEEARRAAQEVRDRTLQIAESGLSAADQSRLQLSRDLLAIDGERLNAERALAQARASNDAAGIRDAQQRLRIAQAATEAAKDQNRQRQLQALGLDQSLLNPAQTIRDEFQKVRDAFDKNLIDPEQAKNALRNLAREGIDIRKEIDRELSRPSAEALRVSDIRSSEGIAQFFAAGRRDAAVDQRAEQIRKLEEIRAALIAVGARPVDILGAA